MSTGCSAPHQACDVVGAAEDELRLPRGGGTSRSCSGIPWNSSRPTVGMTGRYHQEELTVAECCCRGSWSVSSRGVDDSRRDVAMIMFNLVVLLKCLKRIYFYCKARTYISAQLKPRLEALFDIAEHVDLGAVILGVVFASTFHVLTWLVDLARRGRALH